MPRRTGLEIDYRAGELAELEGQFDLVTCMEVIEHVADPAAFVKALARAARAGRPADHVDPERDRLVEAADDHPWRRHRADPARARTISTSSSRPTA